MAGWRSASASLKEPIEAALQVPFDRPAAHMSEYLSVLLPTLTDRKVDFVGDIWSGVTDGIGVPPTSPPRRCWSRAMGPRMLALAGGRTDGAVLWLSGPRTIDEHLRPALAAAAEEAGRPEPRIVPASRCASPTSPTGVRELIAALLAGYNDLPSYRGVMDREGVDGPAGVSVVGDEDEVRKAIQRFADTGATDFVPVEVATNPDEAARTALLTELAAVVHRRSDVRGSSSQIRRWQGRRTKA